MTAPHRLPMNILFSEESSHSAEFRTNQKSSENQCLCTMWNIIHARFWTNKQIINRLTEFGKMARRLMRDSQKVNPRKKNQTRWWVPAVFFYDVLKQEKIDDGSALNNDSNKIRRLKFSVFVFFPLPFVSVDISELQWRNRDESLMLGPAPSRAF
jgi:hypothetical protein